ncbi:nuclear transport factor 2 family protein [Micromonospora sp. R77]|uniref:nuclear transport factor 2 family protein n=1 Tax=Micromonospora sp. R77 TaxID=2925836 RepID=UPI001F6250E3|nr:nuclear transport factor 2 family protein [Micromonospora sp. R77]MCI4066797.1 nuclear transport factor 2 family protein [Micromonospora sp. R77]
MEGSTGAGSRESRVRRYYELVDRRAVADLVDLFATDAEYHRPGYPPLVGKDTIERFYRQDRVIASGHHAIAVLISAAEGVAVHGDFRGELRDGRQVELRFADFFRFADDDSFARRDTFFFAPLV